MPHGGVLVKNSADPYQYYEYQTLLSHHTHNVHISFNLCSLLEIMRPDLGVGKIPLS